MADFSNESYDVPYVMVRPSNPTIWTVCTRHHPGLTAGGKGTINNRAVVFKLVDDDSSEFLLVFGVPSGTGVQAVQKLASDEHLPVRFVLSSGGAHHMYLEDWFEGFPEARILIPGQKIPHTRNGQELKVKYADRWEEFLGTTFPCLEKYNAQVEFIIFNQLCLYRDEEGMAKSGKEQATLGTGGLMFAVMKQLMSKDGFAQDFDAVWFYCPPAKLVCVEHNMDMWATKEQLATFPWYMKLMMKTENYALAGPQMGTKIRDVAVHAATWKHVLEECLFDTMTCLHRPPGMTQSWSSTQEATRELRQMVHDAGEDDPTGKRMYFNRPSNTKYYALAAAALAGSYVYLRYLN